MRGGGGGYALLIANFDSVVTTLDTKLLFYSVSFILQSWPEATDPHKFVYEDIAIATYLLVRTYLAMA